jgi:hypothetical protein
MAPKAKPTPEQLKQFQETLNRSESDLGNAKVAYFSRTDYKGEAVSGERLRQYAQAYVDANHAYQRALYGKIRVRLDVSRLLRE